MSAPLQHHHNVPSTQLVKLTSSQAESCRYPLACPVWIASRVDLHGANTPGFQQGIVQSVWMDFVTNEVVYDVLVSSVGLIGTPVEKYGEVHSFKEAALAYAPCCPIYVSSGDGRVQAGVVLLPKHQYDGAVFYTIQLDGHFQENVEATSITYRRDTVFKDLPVSSVALQPPLPLHQFTVGHHVNSAFSPIPASYRSTPAPPAPVHLTMISPQATDADAGYSLDPQPPNPNSDSDVADILSMFLETD